MKRLRTDETWHRLREWTQGQATSERLAAQCLLNEGYSSLDPSHPLGGKDGGKDALCKKDGQSWVMAVYFPRGEHKFEETRKKFLSDLNAAAKLKTYGFIFVTNQELRLAQRQDLLDTCHHLPCEIYHLEKITAILDSPAMLSVRQQFLYIDYETSGGGKGGNAAAIEGAKAIGGNGGIGNSKSPGGRGGDASAEGLNSIAIGGDGGNAMTPDGRGGKRSVSPCQVLNLPTEFWKYGYGGAGENHPEYERRLNVLINARKEYRNEYPDFWRFVEAGVDIVPIIWINKHLEELGESWRIEASNDGGYMMPDLNDFG